MNPFNAVHHRVKPEAERHGEIRLIPGFLRLRINFKMFWRGSPDISAMPISIVFVRGVVADPRLDFHRAELARTWEQKGTLPGLPAAGFIDKRGR